MDTRMDMEALGTHIDHRKATSWRVSTRHLKTLLQEENMIMMESVWIMIMIIRMDMIPTVMVVVTTTAMTIVRRQRHLIHTLIRLHPHIRNRTHLHLLTRTHTHPRNPTRICIPLSSLTHIHILRRHKKRISQVGFLKSSSDLFRCTRGLGLDRALCQCQFRRGLTG